MSLQIRRGTEAERVTAAFEEGELIWTTDTERLWVGDGITQGGVPLAYGIAGYPFDGQESESFTESTGTITRTGGAVTATFPAGHGFASTTGIYLQIFASGDDTIDGVFNPVTRTDDNTLTWTQAGELDASTTGFYWRQAVEPFVDGEVIAWDDTNKTFTLSGISAEAQIDDISFDSGTIAQGALMKWDSGVMAWIPTTEYITLLELQNELALSADFAEFKARILAL